MAGNTLLLAMALKVLYFLRKFAVKTNLVRVLFSSPRQREMWVKPPMRGAAVWGFFKRSIWHPQPANFPGPAQIQRGANRLDLASFPQHQHPKMKFGVMLAGRRATRSSFFTRVRLRASTWPSVTET